MSGSKHFNMPANVWRMTAEKSSMGLSMTVIVNVNIINTGSASQLSVLAPEFMDGWQFDPFNNRLCSLLAVMLTRMFPSLHY